LIAGKNRPRARCQRLSGTKSSPDGAAHPTSRSFREINEFQKADFLGNAPLCVSICWPEPFGLVMIEAWLWNTVIALAHGSVPEVDRPCVSGLS